MGANASTPSTVSSAIGTSSEPKKCKACCACPETKQARDKCIVENGAENCEQLIEAHKECMRKMGFKV